MEKNVVFDMIKLNRFDNVFSVYNNVLGVADIDSSFINKDLTATKFRLPIKTNTIGMVWTLEGESKVLVENTPYLLRKNKFLFIPSKDSVQLLTASPDFRAQMIIVDKTFMNECITNKKVLSFFNFILIKRLLVTELTSEETDTLTLSFNNLKDKIKADSHSYYKEVVPVNFLSLLLDISHILSGKKDSGVSHQSTRKEEIFNKFLDLLLVNYKEQHEVSFYADKLFITPQYLTLIIKELTGKTTNKWIDDTLILEARKLLRNTQTPVQQIADLLNFSDQSTFGKFFKKYHGVSPAEYRKVHYTSLSIA